MVSKSVSRSFQHDTCSSINARCYQLVLNKQIHQNVHQNTLHSFFTSGETTQCTFSIAIKIIAKYFFSQAPSSHAVLKLKSIV